MSQDQLRQAAQAVDDAYFDDAAPDMQMKIAMSALRAALAAEDAKPESKAVTPVFDVIPLDEGYRVRMSIGVQSFDIADAE